MGGHLVPAFHHYLHGLFGMQALWVAQFVLTALVLLGPGRVFYARGVPALLRGAPDMNSLVALGTGAAFAYSVIATFAPALLPDGARAVYFEAAAVIVTLILLGRWLEGRAKGRTGAAIAKLAGLQPRFAHRLDADGQGQDVAITDLRAGDRVLVRPGERLPADGVVADGSALVDESMITGEPLPALREAGAKVTGGTVNGGGGAFVLFYILCIVLIGLPVLLSETLIGRHGQAAARDGRERGFRRGHLAVLGRQNERSPTGHLCRQVCRRQVHPHCRRRGRCRGRGGR
jgi:cation transport ATPase